MPPKVKITKEEIIRAAFEITKESGVEAVTAKSVAKRLNCSTQPVYWVFDTMDNLRREVTAEANKEYNRYLLTEIPGLPKYKSTGWNYIRFAKEQPELFKLLYMTDRQENISIAESNLDENKEYIIALIIEQYGLSQKAANDLYVNMWLFSHGIAAMLVTKTVRLEDDEISRKLTEAFSGMLKLFTDNESKGEI